MNILCPFFLLISCSSTEETFSYKNHCSGEAFKRIKHVNDLQKKVRLGEANKLESEIVKRTHLFSRDSETTLKPLMFECLAEAERMGNRKIYNICTVVEVDLKGKLVFLDIDDKQETIEPKLKKCLTDQLQSFDYGRYPGVTAVQAINMDLDP